MIACHITPDKLHPYNLLYQCYPFLQIRRSRVTLRQNVLPKIFPPPSERKRQRIRGPSVLADTSSSLTSPHSSSQFPNIIGGFSTEPLNLSASSQGNGESKGDWKFPNLLASPVLDDAQSTSLSDSHTGLPRKRKLFPDIFKLEPTSIESPSLTYIDPPSVSEHKPIVVIPPPISPLAVLSTSNEPVTSTTTHVPFSNRPSTSMKIKLEMDALVFDKMTETIRKDVPHRFPSVVVHDCGNHMLLYRVRDTDNANYNPMIDFSLRILMDMTVRVWLRGTRLEDAELDWVLSDSNGRITQWNQLFRILSKYIDGIANPSPDYIY